VLSASAAAAAAWLAPAVVAAKAAPTDEALADLMANPGAVADKGVDSWLDRMDRGSSDGKNRGVEPPPPSRSKADGKVAASVSSPLGPAAKPVQVAFVSPWKEKKGGVLNFGDSKRGTDAFVALAVVAPAAAKSLDPKGGVASVPQAVLLEAMLGRDTRYGTYGSASNVKVWRDAAVGNSGQQTRVLEVSFTAQGANLEVDRRVAAAFALPAPGLVAVLVAGAPKAKWADAAADANAMAASFQASISP